MAAPARKSAPNSAPSAKKPPPGKGKAAPAEPETEKAPPAPPSKAARFRLILFGALGGLFLITLVTGAWLAFFRAPPDNLPIPPPPALKPTPPTVVREGDLNDDLWRQLGVRPSQD